jgi:N-acyl homoserine lactone hydrolase
MRVRRAASLVQIISAYGHTPGHQVLFLDLPKYGPLVLSGDLYHFRISRREKLVPQFNFDAAMTLKAMAKVEKFVKENKATFWIEHDYAGFKELKTAPDFYE